MCEVLSADGTPHPSNGRATIEDDDNDFWFGFEQEYFLWDPGTNKAAGFPDGVASLAPRSHCLVGHRRRCQRIWPRYRGRASGRLPGVA